MIAKHVCIHDKYRAFYPKEEHCVTTYFKEYPAASVLEDGVDEIHYVVVELLPDELENIVFVKSKIVEL